MHRLIEHLVFLRCVSFQHDMMELLLKRKQKKKKKKKKKKK